MLARRKIVFVLPTLNQGGAETVIARLLSVWDYDVYDTYLIILNKGIGSAHVGIPKEVKLIDLNVKRARLAIFGLIKWVWILRPDMLFVTLGYLNLLVALIRCTFPSKTIVIGRETSLPSRRNKSIIIEFLYRHFLNRLDKVICQSRAMQDDLLDYYGCDVRKLCVINNPLPIDLIRSEAFQKLAPDEIRYISNESNLPIGVVVGRLEVVKGHDRLFRAIARMDKEIFVVVIGDGSQRKKLAQLTRQLGLENRIRFLGHKTNPFPYLAYADFAFMPSLVEGFPNVVLEALACGTPVLAMPTPGGLADIASTCDGIYVCDTESISAYSDLIQRYVDVERAKTTKPFRGVEEYKLEKIALQYRNLISSMITEREC